MDLACAQVGEQRDPFVSLSARVTGLPKEPVPNASAFITLDKAILTERVGQISRSKVELILAGSGRDSGAVTR